MINSLEDREKKVVSLEKELDDRQKHLRTEVNKKVEKKLAEKESYLQHSYNQYESQLEMKYRMFEAKYIAGFVLTLIYGIVVTVIQMFKNEIFKTDLINFGKAIADTGVCIHRLFANVIDTIYGLKLTGNSTGDKVINVILIVAIIIAVILIIRFICKIICEHIKPVITSQMDRYLLSEVLIIVAGNVFFCDFIKFILSINLIASTIGKMCIYLVVRILNNINRDNVGQKCEKIH